MEKSSETAELRGLRALILAVMAFSVVGTLAELVLLEHYESTSQWIPLAGLGAAVPLLAIAALRPTRGFLRFFQVVMGAFLAMGAIGLWLHYTGNVEFAKETYPGLEGWALFREAATGATPLLAPGTMAQLGLLGLAFTYRHPLLRPALVTGK